MSSQFTKVPSWSSTPNAELPLADAVEKQEVNHLNAEQEAAIEVLTGRHLINAGAGTGKTTCLVARTRKILEMYPESRVLLISFTKKSVEELRQRIGSTPKVEVSTFHSLAFHILRSAGMQFQVAMTSEAEQDALISEIIGQRNTTIEAVKQSLRKTEPKHEDTKVAREEYLAYLREHQQMTFDTMQLFALRLLRENKAVLRAWSGKVTHILVDEYQDVDELQAEIVELLSQRTGNLTVAGDSRQSIYSFRGAVPDAISNFAKTATQHDLTVSHRSGRGILGLANLIMPQEKPLLAAIDNPVPVYPKYLEAYNAEDEAATVLDEITYLHKKGTPYKDMAILYRSSAASSNIIPLLSKRKITEVNKGTIHSSKGREWSVVFVVGAAEGCLPSIHCQGSAIEEERRLLYTAVTRAKSRLYISYPRISNNHKEPNEPSRFLSEIF